MLKNVTFKVRIDTPFDYSIIINTPTIRYNEYSTYQY